MSGERVNFFTYMARTSVLSAPLTQPFGMTDVMNGSLYLMTLLMGIVYSVVT